MSIAIMRAKIEDCYHAEKWRDKVKKMSDNQVVAVYNKFLREGKIK